VLGGYVFDLDKYGTFVRLRNCLTHHTARVELLAIAFRVFTVDLSCPSAGRYAQLLFRLIDMLT
jgi:hypothetical protein